MKRIISALLILILLIPPMTLPAAAATEDVTYADSTVFVTVEKTGGSAGDEVTIGDEVTVTVAHKNIPACSSVEFVLTYDPEYLQEPADADVKKNISGLPYPVSNPTYIIEERFSQELAGRQAVMVAAANSGNCLKGDTLFSVKFKVKKEAPAPGIPLEFLGTFNNLYSDRDMRSTIQVVNTHIATTNSPKSVSNVSLIKPPSKTEYVQGQALKMEGGRLKVTYSDGTQNEVRLSMAEVTQYDFNQLGTQTVKATYAEKEISFEIQTEESTLSSISVGKTPNKIEYTPGATGLNMTGGILLLHYTSGVVETLDMNHSSVSVSDYDDQTLDNQKITVTYTDPKTGKEETTDYMIGVVRKPLEAIDVRTPMICTACYEGGEDKTGIWDAVDLIEQKGGTSSDTATFSSRQAFFMEHNECPLCQGNTLTTKMKMLYYLGEDFDVQNATLVVTYNDDTTEELPLTKNMVNFRNTIATEQTVQVTYGTQKISIKNVETKQKEIVEVTVSKKPLKMTYIQGQPFDPTGGKILVKYDNGTEEELSMGHADVIISYKEALGDCIVIVSYRYKKTYFSVHFDARAVESIAVDPTAKSTYIQGTPLNLDTKLVVKYNDDTIETAYLRDATWSGYDAEKIGPQDVLVTYGKKDYTWKVLVEEKPIVNVRKLEIIGSLPATIVEGLELNLENCTLTATYEDDTVEEEIPITAPMITFNREAGKQQVTVSYKEKTVTFEIEVLKKEVVDLKIEGTLPTAILEGTELNLEDCTLTATYNDGEVKNDIPITPAMVGYDKQVGEQTVTVSYDGQTVTFKIHIQATTAQGIEIAVLPQFSYLEGKDTALNLAGGKITVFYDNNTTALVSLTDPSVKVSGFDKNVLGKQTITVRYLDIFTDTFDVFMNEKEIVGITLAALPSQTMYRQGVEKFDPKGGWITVFYNNDTQETLNLSEAKISGFSNLFAGNVTVTATYEGYAVEFTVLILAESSFKDLVLGEYYEKPVLWAVTKGITTGTSKTTFAPEDECTRGQIVTFLWRTAGKPKPQTTKNPFKDVQKDAYYYEAVLWAVENKITTGTSKNTFSPDAACTRGQVATFLWRAKGEPAANSTNPFMDLQKGEYYYNAVLWAVENKITNGMSDTTFAPSNTCTRGHIVTFLYRTYEVNR